MLGADGRSVQVVDGTMVLEATVNASALGLRQHGASSLLWAHGGTRALSYHGASGRGLFTMSASGVHRLGLG